MLNTYHNIETAHCSKSYNVMTDHFSCNWQSHTHLRTSDMQSKISMHYKRNKKHGNKITSLFHMMCTPSSCGWQGRSNLNGMNLTKCQGEKLTKFHIMKLLSWNNENLSVCISVVAILLSFSAINYKPKYTTILNLHNEEILHRNTWV